MTLLANVLTGNILNAQDMKDKFNDFQGSLQRFPRNFMDPVFLKDFLDLYKLVLKIGKIQELLRALRRCGPAVFQHSWFNDKQYLACKKI